MSNEVLYAAAAVVSLFYGLYKWQFAFKRNTDYDDYKLMQAFVVATKKGLIK